jgi:hypothetical protein
VIPAGLYDMAGVEARVGPKADRAGRPRSSHTPDELSDEAFRPSARSGRSLSEPDVEDLAGVCTRANQRVVAEHLGVAEGGALLVVAIHRTDRGIDVDGHRLGTGPRAKGPRPGEHRLGDLVELADVAEAEHLRNAKLVFRTTVVIDARSSGIHRLPGPQPSLAGRSRRAARSV